MLCDILMGLMNADSCVSTTVVQIQELLLHAPSPARWSTVVFHSHPVLADTDACPVTANLLFPECYLDRIMLLLACSV